MSMEAETRFSVRGHNFKLRAYLAGGGATVALIAAAVLVFASLGAYVAFEGLPIADGEDDAARVAVEPTEAAASTRDGGGSREPEAGADGTGGAGGGGAGGGGSAGTGADVPGVTAAPAATSDGGDGGFGIAPQTVETAAGPNAAQPTSGQLADGGSIPGPVAEVGATVADATGLTVELPDQAPSPFEDAAGASGALGGGLAGEQLAD